MPCQHSCRPSCISKAETRFKGLTNSSKSCNKSFPVGYLYSLEWTTGNETSSPQLLSSVSLSLQASSKADRLGRLDVHRTESEMGLLSNHQQKAAD